VMIVDENLPRNQWTIGIITEVKLSSNDRVRNVKVRLDMAELITKVSRFLIDHHRQAHSKDCTSAEGRKIVL